MSSIYLIKYKRSQDIQNCILYAVINMEKKNQYFGRELWAFRPLGILGVI